MRITKLLKEHSALVQRVNAHGGLKEARSILLNTYQQTRNSQVLKAYCKLGEISKKLVDRISGEKNDG